MARAGSSPILRRTVPTWWLGAFGASSWLLAALYMIHWGAKWNLDLRVYLAAGRSVLNGANPYFGVFTHNRLHFTYPPFALLLFAPLSWTPTQLVKVAWWIVNAGALVSIVFLALRAALHIEAKRALAMAAAISCVTTLALEPLRSNMDYGQINLLLMALVVVDLTRLRAPWRGLLVGLAAAIKLTPLVYLIYFLLERDRRSAIRGIGAFAGAIVVSFLVLPSDAVRFWFHDAFAPGFTGQVGNMSNQSWDGVIHRVPFHGGAVATILWVGAEAATLAVGVLTAKRYVTQHRKVEALLALALTELLISPISWSHHWSWLVLVPVVVLERWKKDRVVDPVLLFTLVIAAAAPYWWGMTGWPGALADDSLALTGALLLVTMMVQASKRTARAAVIPEPSG
jgi:alpha-1,2-mannosyltransferase